LLNTSTAASKDTPPGYRDLLVNNSSYRRLWFGEVISFLGDWLNTIALYTIVQNLTDSAQAVVAVLIAKTLPVVYIRSWY